jgi:predicted O-methyltransferase YrrM
MLNERDRAEIARLWKRKVDQDERKLSLVPGLADLDLALIDCEKDDYARFFDLLRMRPAQPGVESITLAVGKGLEVTRVGTGRSTGPSAG